MQQICNSDENVPIRFVILVDGKGVSYYNTTVKELRNITVMPMTLFRNGKKGGELHFKDFVFTENPNFAEYLRAGWQISLSVAIDFTASNGKVTDPKSLHYPHS